MGMTAWLLLILTLAGPASAQVNGRVSIGEAGANTGQAGAVSPVPAIGATQFGALSPAALGGSLSAAPSAPVPTFAVPAVQAARVAPASALASAQPVVAAAAEFKPAAAAIPSALVPVPAPAAAREGVAPAPAPMPALEGAARVASETKSPSFDAVFDGEKSRSSFFSWPSFGRKAPGVAGPSGEGASRRAILGRSAPGAASGAPAQGTSSEAAVAAPLNESRSRKAGHKGPMPAGVKDAFGKAIIVVTWGIGLSAYLWNVIHSAIPGMTGIQFAGSFLPLTILPVHFALVGAFWWGRYYRYPFLSPSGRARFRAVAEAIAVAYPVAALTALGLWTASLFGHVPAFLSGVLFPWSVAAGSGSAAMAFFVGLLSILAVIALAEVAHHFIWRAPLKANGGRGGAWGNIGQQLLHMRRKP